MIDDNSSDGSPDNLPCNVLRIPPSPWKSNWGQMRANFVNALSRGLFARFDVVIFTDADEFLVPDPRHFDGLLDLVSAKSDQEVIAPVAVNVLHNPNAEPAFDHTRPILAQRRSVKWASAMCKPLTKRTPAPWNQGSHGIQAPFPIDPELYLLHMTFYDLEELSDVADRRGELHLNEGRGSIHRSWSLGSQEIKRQLFEWVESAGDAVPEFSPANYDVAGVIHEEANGFFRSRVHSWWPWRPTR